ncbi:MAG TPA: prolyl-tRNA synthetase associated domain-containing protein [Rhodospirillaceae bacterium]|nr:prolyl-tRNA synthetase associated domain-containing protein [Rhodospirillaceae bacterium]
MQTNPPFYAQNLLDFLTNLQISYRLYTHEPVFTVEEAHKVDKEILGTHTRNMFLRDKKERMFLVTLRHDTPIDLKKLSDLLGVGRFSFGSPERLWTYLGVKPGSVTPLSILNDTGKKVSLVLEKAMMEADLVNFHPLDNSMTIGMTPSELMTILEKQGITPQIIDLSPATPDDNQI